MFAGGLLRLLLFLLLPLLQRGRGGAVELMGGLVMVEGIWGGVRVLWGGDRPIED